MRTYILRVDSESGLIDVYWREGEIEYTVPHILDTEFCPVEYLEKVTVYILVHYFADEQDAEIRARLLSHGVARRLQTLARTSSVLHEDPRTGRQDLSFSVTTDELNDFITQTLLDYKPDSSGVSIVYIGGQRRDTVRHESLAETTPRRPMN
jgi:hypothetical protein